MKLFIKIFCGVVWLIGTSANARVNIEPYNSEEWKNLLHYVGEKSTINADSDFFLSTQGYRNPKAEYVATLNVLFQGNKQKQTVCNYPARYNYIIKSEKRKYDTFVCKEYKEYWSKVPIDQVSIVFAAENNLYPSSVMGHTFLKLTGKVQNKEIEHALSYSAILDNKPDKYIKMIMAELNGVYSLSPYRDKMQTYLGKEKRSIWEFTITLTPEEIDLIKQHIWELRGKNIKYSLISNNCSSAIINILKIANQDFDIKKSKPFITPIEYIKYLKKKKKIKKNTLIPTKYAQSKISRHGVKDILTTNNPSRIEISYHNTNKNHINLKLSPVYQDINDKNNSYYDEMESKLGEIELGYTGKKAFIQSINIIKTKSILDYFIEQDYSQYFKLAFENNLHEYTSNLKPTIEIGRGIGSERMGITFYTLIKLGYRHNKGENLYISPEIGGIINFSDKIKISTSFEAIYANQRKNMNYNRKYKLYTGYKISHNNEVYAEINKYKHNNNETEISIGVVYRF